MVELTAEALGGLDTAQMVTLPTSLFLTVYIGSMASAARLLRGALRGVAALACAASVAVLAFSGPAALLAVAAFAVALLTPMRAGADHGSRTRSPTHPDPSAELQASALTGSSVRSQRSCPQR